MRIGASSFEELLDPTSAEFEETRAAVMEGLEQAERGAGRPARDVFRDLRAKHGLQR